MRGFGGFVAYRFFRTLVALWLVSTVVFVVMRLSGDPVPLLLPPDAPISEMERVRRDLGHQAEWLRRGPPGVIGGREPDADLGGGRDIPSRDR